MHPLWSGGVVVIACGITVALTAQAPGTPASPATGKQIKVGGCLEKVPEADVATIGTKYQLTYARRANVKDGPTATRYRLIVDDAKISADLVEMRVMITGQVEDAGSDPVLTTSGTNAVAAASDAAEQARRASFATAPKLRVETIEASTVVDGTGQTRRAEFCP